MMRAVASFIWCARDRSCTAAVEFPGLARGPPPRRPRGSSSLVGVQHEYSLINRAADHELLPAAEAFGLGACLYAPLAGGLLTGKYRQGSTGRLEAWGRGVHTEDTALVPVIAPRTVALLRDYLAARQVSLSAEQYDRLSQVSAVAGGEDDGPFAFEGDTHRFCHQLVPVVLAWRADQS
jgi:hypothetical protein